MTSIFLPTSTLKQSEDCKYLTELLFVDYDELSPREKAKMDKAMEFGEIYHATHTILASGTQVFATDLGSPKESARVEIRVPGYVAKEKAVWMLTDLVDKLMEI
jgi:hypothetical protein